MQKWWIKQAKRRIEPRGVDRISKVKDRSEKVVDRTAKVADKTCKEKDRTQRSG
jgi:hypothetical protein